MQVSTQAKISSFKNPHIKTDLLPRSQNPLSYYILCNESKHNILAFVSQANKCWNIGPKGLQIDFPKDKKMKAKSQKMMEKK